MTEYIGITICGLVVGFVLKLVYDVKKARSLPLPPPLVVAPVVKEAFPSPEVNMALIGSNFNRIEKLMSEIPARTLNTIQGSANNTSGKMAEMFQLLSLKNMYDRIIPLSSIADFLCIKFPEGKEPGLIHFVEIKSGKARLSADQLKFSKMFEDPKSEISMKTVKTEVS